MAGCKVPQCPINSDSKRIKANSLSDSEFIKSYPHIPLCIKIKFFGLPSNEDLAKKWLSVCGFEDDLSPEEKKKIIVCTNHFTKDKYNVHTLHNLEKLLEQGKRKTGPIAHLFKPEYFPNTRLPSIATHAELGHSQIDRRIRQELKEHKAQREKKIKPASSGAAKRSEPTPTSVTKRLAFDRSDFGHHSSSEISETSETVDAASADHTLSSVTSAAGPPWTLTPQQPPGQAASSPPVLSCALPTARETGNNKIFKRLQGKILKMQPSPVKTLTKVSKVRDEGPITLDSLTLLQMEKGMNAWEKKLEDSERKRKSALAKAAKSDAQLMKIKKEMDRAEEKLKQLEELEDAVGAIFSPKQLNYLKKCKKEGKARVVWEKDDLASALTLLSMSPKVYEYLRRKKGLPLPSPTTVRRFMAQFPVEPGVQDSVFKSLKIHGAKKTPLQKMVVLAFDEMQLRERMEYDAARDKIIGPFKYTQVVIARGLYDNWREPVFYAFDCPMSKEILNTLIGKFKAVDYNVIACVSDMGPSNQKLLHELNITTEKPYFRSSHVENNIYFYADSPHLLKLIRNHLLDDGYVLEPDASDMEGRREVHGDHLKGLLAPDVSPHVRLHKLTPHHFAVRFMERQRVHLAKDVFSEDVSNALHDAEMKNKMHPSVTLESRNFVTVVNRWFRLFNTARDKRVGAHDNIQIPACDLPFGAALEEQLKILSDMSHVFERCKLVGKEQRKKPPFQEGILLNCAALRMMHAELKLMFPTEDVSVLTTRVNSDTAERFFSQMRGARANNPNPTASDFRFRFRNYLLGNNPDETILGMSTNVRAGEDDPMSTRQQATLNVVRVIEEGYLDLVGHSVDVPLEESPPPLYDDIDFAEPEMLAALREECQLSKDEARLWSTVGNVCNLPGQMADGDSDSEEEDENNWDHWDVVISPETAVCVISDELPDGFFGKEPEDGPEVECALDELKVGGVLHLAGVVAFTLAESHPELTDFNNFNNEPMQWWITAYPQQGYFPPSELLARKCNDIEEFFQGYNGMGCRGKSNTLAKMKNAAIQNVPEVEDYIVKSYLAVRLRFRLRYVNTNKSWKFWPKTGKPIKRKKSCQPKRGNCSDPTGRVGKRLRSELY